MSATDADAPALRSLLERHAEATGSERAHRLLAHWPESLAEVLRVSVPVVEALKADEERVAAGAAS
jgi:glutamate synthase domain-containing protein 3